MKGIFYGVGVGPGDPELITLKALRIIQTSDAIVYPCPEIREDNTSCAKQSIEKSFAYSIVANIIPEAARKIPFVLPMQRKRDAAQHAYDTVLPTIHELLTNGINVTFLCEGDPLLYGSFMYVLARIQNNFPCEIVPGITSISAASACTQYALAARNHSLTILSGLMPEEEMKKHLTIASTSVILKAGHHIQEIKRLLDSMNLIDKALYIEHISLPEQFICALNEAPDKGRYFSLIIVRREVDNWT